MTARVVPISRRRIAPAPKSHTSSAVTVSTIQTLHPATCKLVVAAWSDNGQYVAVGLQHGPILIFAVLQQAPQQVSKQFVSSVESASAATSFTAATAPSIRPLRPTALRTFKGHTADVLDLRFSATQFLASASMDRTVRLWHPHTAHCLRRLSHPDMVTAVSFHPTDEDLLLSAGCDGHARLWRLSDESVTAVADAQAVISAAVLLPCQKVCLGTYDGRILTTPFVPIDPSLRSAPGMLPNPTPLQTVDPIRRPRQRRKPTAKDKVRGVVPTTHANVVAVTEGKLSIFTPQQGADSRVLGVRLRNAASRKDTSTVGVFLAPDESFLIIDAAGNSLRVADLRSVRSHVQSVGHSPSDSSDALNGNFVSTTTGSTAAATTSGTTSTVVAANVGNTSSANNIASSNASVRTTNAPANNNTGHAANGTTAPVPEGRRKDRDVSTPMLSWPITDDNVFITCATFAPLPAASRCTIAPRSDLGLTDVALAVIGADDGSLRLVSIHYCR